MKKTTQVTLFGTHAKVKNSYAVNPQNNFERFMNKYFENHEKATKTKTRKELTDAGTELWNSKYKGNNEEIRSFLTQKVQNTLQTSSKGQWFTKTEEPCSSLFEHKKVPQKQSTPFSHSTSRVTDNASEAFKSASYHNSNSLQKIRLLLRSLGLTEDETNTGTKVYRV